MTGHDARDQLSALIDDALGAEERRAVEAHLATCAECRRELERLRSTVALLREVEPARAPVGFVDRVLEAARPVSRLRRLFRALLLPWPVKLPVEAAAIVLVAVGVVYVFRATPELQPARLFDSTGPVTRAADQFAPGPPAPDVAGEAARVQEAAPAKSTEQEGQKAPASQVPKKETAPQPEDVDRRRVTLADASRDVAKRPAEVRSATPGEPPVAGKVEAPLTHAEGAPQAVGERARSSAAPVPERRVDALQAPQSAAAPPAVASLAAPDVSGRLAVADRDSTLQSLARLIARLGGVEDRRVVTDEGPIVELTIPREAYPELLRELTALGRWQLIREAPALPEKVRVILRITG